MSMPKFMVGCDPELFVRNKDTKEFVSAWGMIPGTKEEPFKVPKGAIQVDGNAVEFNIDPASTLPEWHENIETVMDELGKRIPDHCELVIKPTADFNPDYFNALPAEAKELGCVPDYNAYTGTENPRPDGNPPFRTASGHVHVSWTTDKDPNDPDHRADCDEVIKQLDFYVGVPSLVWDKDQRRRQMYGKAGACRYKSYGVEYRTPSNMWLDDKVSRSYVFNATIAALSDLFENRAYRVTFGDKWAQRLIDDNPEKMHREYMRSLNNNSNRLAQCNPLSLYSHFEAKNAPPKPLLPKIRDYNINDINMGEPLRRWAPAPAAVQAQVNVAR